MTRLLHLPKCHKSYCHCLAYVKCLQCGVRTCHYHGSRKLQLCHPCHKALRRKNP